MTEIRDCFGSRGKQRIFRRFRFEGLPHVGSGFHQCDGFEKFGGFEHGANHAETIQPLVGISQRTKSQIEAGAKPIDGFAQQGKLRFKCGAVLARREGFRGTAARSAGGRSADDFFQLAKFEKCFCRLGHKNLKRIVAVLACGNQGGDQCAGACGEDGAKWDGCFATRELGPSESTMAAAIASIVVMASIPCCGLLLAKIAKTRDSPRRVVAYPEMARTFAIDPVFAWIRPVAGPLLKRCSNVPSTPAMGSVERKSAPHGCDLS